jgi:hypothetical protein
MIGSVAISIMAGRLLIDAGARTPCCAGGRGGEAATEPTADEEEPIVAARRCVLFLPMAEIRR